MLVSRNVFQLVSALKLASHADVLRLPAWEATLKSKYRRHTDPNGRFDQNEIKRNKGLNYFKQNCPIFRFAIHTFLDVQVHLINNHIQTDLHTKSTDKHQYLLKTSCHPNHTKKAIPFSLFLRIRRICSTDTFLTKEAENSSNTLPNVVIAAPHYKETRIAFAQSTSRNPSTASRPRRGGK